MFSSRMLHLGTRKAGLSVAYYEFTIKISDGAPEKVMERSTLPVLDQAGRAIGWMIVLRDVTEENQIAEARELITRKAGELSRKLGVKFSKLTIRDQRTRWASCSHKGTLSFNWRLIMVPEVVLEYVIVHELCHLRQMNHSKRFWGLVCKFDPGWEEHRKWIDSHSRELRTALT